jgi:hypothetical protein
MAMVCPQCNGTFEQRLQCPTCSVRLLYQAPSRKRGGVPGAGEEPWQHTPWGRIFIGLLLSQGLYYVLRNLCTAGLLAAGDAAPANARAALSNLVLLQGLQVAGVLAAGILCGAGKHQGFVFGALVGVWNGVLFLIAQQFTGQSLTAIAMIGQPLLQAAFGAVGGFIGSTIWRPMPSLQLLLAFADTSPRLPPAESPPLFAGPVAWGRVVTGTAVAVGGVIWANVILDFVLAASEGKLTIDSSLQAQLVTWEICALAMVVGSCLAGAGTLNGAKQGLAVGVGTSSILLGLGIASGGMPVHLLLFTVTSSLSLGLVGGWFGGQLFPPLNPTRRRQHFDVAAL